MKWLLVIPLCIPYCHLKNLILLWKECTFKYISHFFLYKKKIIPDMWNFSPCFYFKVPNLNIPKAAKESSIDYVTKMWVFFNSPLPLSRSSHRCDTSSLVLTSVFAILFRANFDYGKTLVIFDMLSTKINTIKNVKNLPAFAFNSCK